MSGRDPRSLPPEGAFVNRRAHFRIPFPEPDRPRLVVGLWICEVIDCSEGGIRFVPAVGDALAVGDRVEGRLRFRRGVEVAVAGAVVRDADGVLSLRLEGGGIPFHVILYEQLYLRRLARAATPPTQMG